MIKLFKKIFRKKQKSKQHGITVKVSADTSEFVTAIDDAKHHAKQLQQALEKVNDTTIKINVIKV